MVDIISKLYAICSIPNDKLQQNKRTKENKHKMISIYALFLLLYTANIMYSSKHAGKHKVVF